MAVGLLVLVLVPALVVLVVRTTRADGAPPAVQAVRMVFQYALLYGLAVVVANGLTGLAGELFAGPALARADQTALARDLAFTVVGVPLLTGLALWTRRALTGGAAERRSPGWAGYVTAVSLTALVMAMNGMVGVLRWATGLADYSGPALAATLVWGATWVVHRSVERRLVPPEHAVVHHLAGSLVGLVTAAVGLGELLAGSLRILWGLDAAAVLTAGGDPVLQGLVTFVPGAAVWVRYWARGALRYRQDPLRLAYLLLFGVAGGLVTAVASASTLVYSGLVWVLGEPGTTVAAEYFDGAPAATAAAAVGLLVWWYHRTVLAADTGGRTEATRVYEYLMAAIGLVAAAGGLSTLVAAAVGTATGPAFVGGSDVDTLLAGATLLLVGGPVWWLYWRRIRAASRTDAAEEAGSPTRRVYLAVLLGVGAVAAVVGLLTAVYLLLQDAVPGTVGAETFRRMRFAVGILCAAPAVAGYHLAVRRADRRAAPAQGAPAWPTFLLLLGVADRDVARQVARRTRARVQVWARTDTGALAWSADEVLAALGDTPPAEAVVLADAGALRVLPVRRRPAPGGAPAAGAATPPPSALPPGVGPPLPEP